MEVKQTKRVIVIDLAARNVRERLLHVNSNNRDSYIPYVRGKIQKTYYMASVSSQQEPLPCQHSIYTRLLT